MNFILMTMAVFELLVFIVALCNCASSKCVDRSTELNVAVVSFGMLIIQFIVMSRI